MNTAKTFLLICVLNCAPLTLSAGTLPNPLVDLPDAIFNRPRFAGGGVGGGGVYGGMRLSRFAIVGNIIYVADGPMGLVIYDVTDPAGPRQDGIEMEGAGRLVGVKISDSDQAEPNSEQTIVAVVGDRAYISRDDGVVVLELHGFGLPPLPLIARRDGADPISPEAWLPNGASVRQPVTKAREDAPAANPTEVSMPVIKQDGFGPTQQPSSLGPPSPQPIRITGVVESGVFRLLVSGRPGQATRVQRSSSLSDGWEEWQTVTLGDAPIELTDEEAASADQIFYRAITP